jgi:glycosyltransferase involved in cell wall biosynthesis
MKTAFINTGAKQNDPNRKLRNMFCEASLMQGIECVGYAPTDLDKPFKLHHTDGKTYTQILPCKIPVMSKLARRIGRSPIRKLIIAIENVTYAVNVIRKLSDDKADVYIILHLWDPEIPFLNLILQIFRPTMIMWFGGSLRWYAQSSKWEYYLFVSAFRLSMHFASVTLISLDPEQEYYLFKVLKLPRKKVANFKEFIVDDKLFRKLDKDTSARKVGFNRNEINIIMVTRIESIQRVNSCKDYEKDPFTALEIFRRLTQKEPKVKLHVFGRGQGMEDFKKRTALYNLRDRVKIHGWIEQEKLPEYYAAADLTFFPHPFITVNDGQANHESLLCGTPVVFFKRYPWTKTEHQGSFAIDRNPEEGAQQIFERLNPDYLNKKREEAVAIPHDFSIESFGNNLAKILKNIMDIVQ